MHQRKPLGLTPSAANRLPTTQGSRELSIADGSSSRSVCLDLAEQHLRAAGMRILNRNWRRRYGTLDMVVADQAVTVFVEIQTPRATVGGARPVQISRDRKDRLRRMALLWLVEQSGPRRKIRFDVVSVMVDPGHSPTVVHVQAAF
ncbi:YraN family protein [Nocardia asteroides]|uniref:YraN family protein n=1 Tax=Nocardia asteroides TaxID=1824 RepID=UPI003413B270